MQTLSLGIGLSPLLILVVLTILVVLLRPLRRPIGLFLAVLGVVEILIAAILVIWQFIALPFFPELIATIGGISLMIGITTYTISKQNKPDRLTAEKNLPHLP